MSPLAQIGLALAVAPALVFGLGALFEWGLPAYVNWLERSVTPIPREDRLAAFSNAQLAQVLIDVADQLRASPGDFQAMTLLLKTVALRLETDQ